MEGKKKKEEEEEERKKVTSRSTEELVLKNHPNFSLITNFNANIVFFISILHCLLSNDMFICRSILR